MKIFKDEKTYFQFSEEEIDSMLKLILKDEKHAKLLLKIIFKEFPELIDKLKENE